ncbi:MAG: hypothetical protein RBR15_17540 [Sphaerochaeta sp.]|nr:hypothetical protein [Sphaerochaeta sp.]
METNKHLTQHSKAFEQGYRDIEQLIDEAMKDNRSFKKTYKAILAQGEASPSPEPFADSALTYLLSHILTDAKALKRLMNKHEEALQPGSKQVLSTMIEHPAYWSYFSVVETHEDDFFTIMDLLTKEKHLLYSPRLSALLSENHTKDKNFLTLAYSNGECLHTAGRLRFYSLPVSDLRFYSSLFDDTDTDALDGATLGSIISNNYIEFFRLDVISPLTKQYDGKNQEILRIWQPFTLEEFDITELGGEWERVEVEDQIKYNFLDPDEGMRSLPNGKLLFSDAYVMDAQVIRDTSTGEMWLTTWTDKAYQFFSCLLSHSYPNLKLPRIPSYTISFPLAMLLMNMEFEVPWSPFKEVILALTDSMIEDLFGDDDEDEDEDVVWQLEEEEAYKTLPDTQPMQYIKNGSVVDEWMAEFEKEDEIQNKLETEYLQSRNNGIPFDQEEFCLRTGALPENVARFVLERDYYTVPPVDKEFELEGLPLAHRPSQWFFSQSLVDSELFQFDQGPNTLDAFNALTEGKYKDEYFSVGLLGFIEGAFIEFFSVKRFAYIVANNFFWLLFHRGKDWLPVRSYAIEMLKLMPGLILQKYDDPEAFIADVSLFTKKYLPTRGICTLQTMPLTEEVTQGTFLIKGSEAFYSLVEGVMD